MCLKKHHPFNAEGKTEEFNLASSKHHYLPRGYQRLFLEPGETELWRYSVEHPKPARKGPGGIGWESNLHTYPVDGQEPDALEKVLSTIESACVPVLASWESGPWQPSDEELALVAMYLGLQLVRVPALMSTTAVMLQAFFSELILQGAQSEEHLEAFGRYLAENAEGEDLPPHSTLEELRRSSQGCVLPANFPALNPKLVFAAGFSGHEAAAFQLQQTFSWQLVRSSGPQFVTSDNPVAVYQPLPRGFALARGLGGETCEVVFPVSSSCCLRLVKAAAPVPPQLHDLSESQVGAINAITILNADSFIVSGKQVTGANLKVFELRRNCGVDRGASLEYARSQAAPLVEKMLHELGVPLLNRKQAGL